MASWKDLEKQPHLLPKHAKGYNSKVDETEICIIFKIQKLGAPVNLLLTTELWFRHLKCS